MIAKTNCQHCRNEFEIDGMNRTEFCPHCGKETVVVAQVQTPAPAATPARGGLVKCPDCGNDVSRKSLFCPACGAFERGLFRNIWRIVSTFWLVSLIFAVLGLIIWKLFEAVGG